jgi:hypothetical protein
MTSKRFVVDRLDALNQVVPKADKLKKLKAKPAVLTMKLKSFVVLSRPIGVDLFRLVPQSDRDRRQRIAIRRSEFLLSPDPPRNELEQIHQKVGAKWREELSEMQLKVLYPGKLGRGAFDGMQWIEGRLFLFRGAFVVLVLNPPQVYYNELWGILVN